MFEEKYQRATKTTKSNLKEKCEMITSSFFSNSNSRRPRYNEHGKTTSYNLKHELTSEWLNNIWFGH